MMEIDNESHDQRFGARHTGGLADVCNQCTLQAPQGGARKRLRSTNQRPRHPEWIRLRLRLWLSGHGPRTDDSQQLTGLGVWRQRLVFLPLTQSLTHAAAGCAPTRRLSCECGLAVSVA